MVCFTVNMTAGPAGVRDSNSGTSEACENSQSELHNAACKSSPNNPQAVIDSSGIAETASGSKNLVPMDTDNVSHILASADALVPPIDWSPLNNTSIVRKKGWPRGRKRRCLPKDAPKAPLSGS